MKYMIGKISKTLEGHGAKRHRWSYRQISVLGRKVDACFSTGCMRLLDTLLLTATNYINFSHTELTKSIHGYDVYAKEEPQPRRT